MLATVFVYLVARQYNQPWLVFAKQHQQVHWPAALAVALVISHFGALCLQKHCQKQFHFKACAADLRCRLVMLTPKCETNGSLYDIQNMLRRTGTVAFCMRLINM